MQAEGRWEECMAHSRMCCYQPASWLCAGSWGINRFIHNNDFQAEHARKVSRLIVGGQGLRGGDVARTERVTVYNCCVWCLLRGIKAVESLYHVTYECEEYSGARVRGVIREILPRAGTEVFLIHRARWSWRELKAIRNFFLDIVMIRDAALGKQRCRASSLQEIAERHWY